MGAIGFALVACSPFTSPKPRLKSGGWGGDHVGLFVESTGVSFLFDCAGGSVLGQIPIARDGSFDVTGTYAGGGNALNADHSSHPTRYFGRVVGDHVTFTRVLLDGTLPDVRFSADFGAAPGIIAC